MMAILKHDLFSQPEDHTLGPRNSGLRGLEPPPLFCSNNVSNKRKKERKKCKKCEENKDQNKKKEMKGMRGRENDQNIEEHLTLGERENASKTYRAIGLLINISN